MKQFLLTLLLIVSFKSQAQFIVNTDADGAYYRQWIFAHQPVIDKFHSDDRYIIYTHKFVLPSLSTDSSGNSVDRVVYALPNGIVRSAAIGNLQKASSTLPGILTSSDWNTFNNKQGAITLTTTGSGSATLVGNTLNIPTPPNTVPGSDNTTAYSAGTAYSLTTTPQKVDFGTTDPVITLPAAGTYIIFTNIKIEYAGLTTVLNACDFKLRRTNNTAADLANAATTFNVVATLLTGTGGDVDIAPIIYTTTNNNDVIELWANRQNGVSLLGNINIGEASIVAIRIY
jgi:hypothetical protein